MNSNNSNFDVVVIGGGASGIMTAITAKRIDKKLSICVIEKSNRVLKKVLATGNGRCNFTNINMDEGNFYSDNRNFFEKVLKDFNNLKTIEFFGSIGVLHVIEDGGKVFPMSLQAASVCDCLRFECERLAIKIMDSFNVTKISKSKNAFSISDGEQNITAGKVVVACGGCASPELGSNGEGFSILKNFGHRITEISPALVQLKTEKSIVHGLQGVKLNAQVTLFDTRTKEKLSKVGELLFTEYGLSGSVVFEITTFCHKRKNLIAEIDVLPYINFNELVEILTERREILKHLTMENFLNGMLNKKVSQSIIKLSGVEKLSLKVSDLTLPQLKSLAKTLKGFSVDVTGTTGFKNAQVTAGGADASEFDNETMESKIVKGLYAVGEVLDVYGDCGGYNLQWAWASGYAAGKAVCEK